MKQNLTGRPWLLRRPRGPTPQNVKSSKAKNSTLRFVLSIVILPQTLRPSEYGKKNAKRRFTPKTRQNPLYRMIGSLVLLVGLDAVLLELRPTSCIGSLHLLGCEIAERHSGNILQRYSVLNDLMKSISTYGGV